MKKSSHISLLHLNDEKLVSLFLHLNFHKKQCREHQEKIEAASIINVSMPACNNAFCSKSKATYSSFMWR